MLFNIIFSSIYAFINTKEQNGKYVFIRYIFMYFIWNMTYLTITNINDIDNIKSTILFKNVYIDLLASNFISYTILYFTKNNKIINIIFSLIFIIISIYLKNPIYLYVSITIISKITKDIKFKSINNKFLDIINNYSLGIYIFHIFLLKIILKLNIINYNNISDLIGSIIFIYIIGIIISYYFKILPILRKLI